MAASTSVNLCLVKLRGHWGSVEGEATIELGHVVTT